MQINYDSALLAIKREVSRLDYDQQEEELTLRAATVLMASLLVGANPQVLADFTHFELSFIKSIAERLQSAGVWRGDEVIVEPWFEDYALPFWLLVYDAAGI